MTDAEPQKEHEELARWFDETAAEASGPTLTKLGARAADIPRLSARRFLGLPRWALGPASAVLIAAFGGFFALRGVHPRPVPSATAAPSVTLAVLPSATASMAVATASEHELTAAAPSARSSEEASDGIELLGDADEGAHFDVSGPQSDRDLDAWLAATKELSGGT